jgi:putative thioredoxin
LVDIDSQPAIAQAVQLQAVPFVFAVIDGRPQPLMQDLVPLDQLRGAINTVMQQLTAQGITGRHQPRQTGPVAEQDGDDAEPFLDPRYAAAQDALGRDDYDGAVAEYQKLLDANPADTEAAAGLAMAKLLQRTQDADAEAARAAVAADPDDVAAQTLLADLDMLTGQVEDAFGRLVELVRRTSGDERNQAREHLLGLFAAVGNDDPRVLKGRQALASALF